MVKNMCNAFRIYIALHFAPSKLGFSAKAQNCNGHAVHNTMALGKQKKLDSIYLERLNISENVQFHTHLHIYAETSKGYCSSTKN